MAVLASNSFREPPYSDYPSRDEIECRAWKIQGGTACPPRIPPSLKAIEEAKEELIRESSDERR
jgi:hypothetical protein